MTMPYVHIGVLVSDLEDSIRRYRQHGFNFMEPHTVHVEHLADEDGQRKELDLRIAFSREGPPHLELLEAVGDGIYGPHHVGGLHHLAVLTDDPVRRRDALVGQGFRATAAQYRADGTLIVAYFEPDDLDGVRLELLDAPVQDAILSWISGDESATP